MTHQTPLDDISMMFVRHVVHNPHDVRRVDFFCNFQTQNVVDVLCAVPCAHFATCAPSSLANTPTEQQVQLRMVGVHLCAHVVDHVLPNEWSCEVTS